MNKEMMQIVIVGHVDHGKSTIIGRLLNDTHSLPEGKLEQVKETCRRNSKPFEYAFLLDALKEEQSQGITIDSARVFFKTEKRNYIIIDAPGHIEFLKNMITGSARAEAALLVIDAQEGVQENSRRHGYMLSMLGIKQMVVLINKMDLVEYQQDVFETIKEEYSRFLLNLGIKAIAYIPVSGREGDMIAERQDRLDWYDGLTVLDMLDGFRKEKELTDKPFRLPVQGVYKFTQFNDDRRVIAGTIASGTVKVGDEIVIYPTGKTSRVKTIELFNQDNVQSISAPSAMGLTLDEQIYVKRGQLACLKKEPPPNVSTRLKVSLFWLGRDPMTVHKMYVLKLGSEKVDMEVEKIEKVINASNLEQTESPEMIHRHEVAECILRLRKAIAFDCIDLIAKTSRFVVVDEYAICGGGIIQERLDDEKELLRDMVRARNYHWIRSDIPLEQRMKKYGQKPILILITGEKQEPRKEIGRLLEMKLFSEGCIVYFLGIGNIIHGIAADLKNEPFTHTEQLRRLGELANVFLDTGMILIVSAIELNQNDKDILKTSLDMDRIVTIWVGDNKTTDIAHDLQIKSHASIEETTQEIRKFLYSYYFNYEK